MTLSRRLASAMGMIGRFAALKASAERVEPADFCLAL
jgi:hypothetical protein